MVTRNVVLSQAQDEPLQALVTSGLCQNASGGMRAGLRLLEQKEAQIAVNCHGLLEGLAQAEADKTAEESREDAIRRAFWQARASS